MIRFRSAALALSLLLLGALPARAQFYQPPSSAAQIQDGSTTNKAAVNPDGTLKVQSNPAPLTSTDRYVTVATGGTPVRVMAANSSRKDGTIQNPPSETTNLYCSSTTSSFAAADGAGVDYDLVPGQGFSLGGATGVAQADIYCTASNAGHKILAKEYQ